MDYWSIEQSLAFGRLLSEPQQEEWRGFMSKHHDWEGLIVFEPMLKFFQFEHLPPQLRIVSEDFAELAIKVVQSQERTPERTVCLRKLLEAKDAAVRNKL